MNDFEKIEKAKELFTWNVLENKKYGFGRIFHRGQCSLHDYERGFYYIRIFVTTNLAWSKKENKFNQQQFSVRVWYQTIDDSDFGGWLNNIPLDYAKQVVDKIKAIYDPLVTLPNDTEMNYLLKHLGIEIKHE